MSSKKHVYWDACCFLALANQERASRGCSDVYRKVETGDIIIFTSALTLVEVHKKRLASGEEEYDTMGEFLGNNTLVRLVSLSPFNADQARKLLIKYKIKKPNDAIHLMSALESNVDEMHTLDRQDLLRLNGKVPKQGGGMLSIIPPGVDDPELNV